ncbi:MAG TPA: hypothetical protein VFP00_04045 [Burkholderiales bacterium]|nr:hypothetical protein [Burkholderiales bacterium]
MKIFDRTRDRSPLAVPWPVWALLLASLSLQVATRALEPPPLANAEALPAPAAPAVVRAASLDEPIAAAQLLTLYLQAFDNQPGVSIPFKDLDYERVAAWLETILALDATTQYPLLMASHLYAQVPDEAKQRLMLDWVHAKFRDDPERRWRWLAHATLMAKHRLRDNALALRYAEDIARLAPGAPSWARQMRLFILEDMGEIESATILLGGLLATGEIKEPSEIRFLTQRLEQMKKAAENSAPVSKY